jgi:dTDP-4-amino-4,6-dideoxygalactose transaminase
MTVSNVSRRSDAITLAICGGVPSFTEPLHVGRPNLGDRAALLSRINGLLDRRWFSNDGPLVKDFEKRIATFLGVRHCVAMCNGTVALENAIRALQLKGEVIVPAFTFIATAHALQWQEITPVFADMDPATHNISADSIERLITPRTTGILGVHVWGRACDTDAIEALGQKHNLTVMYDAAHAFGCSRNGKMIGGFGACEVFSFHATKFLNSFEGGAVVTNDDILAEKLRFMRNFGFSDYDHVTYLGVNGKMTEVCAAMGLTSLEAIDELVAINRDNYERYYDGLHDLPGISVVQYDPTDRNNYQYIVLEVNPEIAPLNRDELGAVLHSENVLTRKYFWPGCHRMEPYRSLQPNASLLLPETERTASRVLLLPNGQAVNKDSVETICWIISTSFSRSDLIKAALSKGTK